MVSVLCLTAVSCVCSHCKDWSSLALPDFIRLLLHRRILGNASDKRLFLSNGGLFIPASPGLRSTAAYGNRQKLKEGWRLPPGTQACWLWPQTERPMKRKGWRDVTLGARRQDGRGEPRWLKGARMVDWRKDQKGSQAGGLRKPSSGGPAGWRIQSLMRAIWKADPERQQVQAHRNYRVSSGPTWTTYQDPVSK